MRKLASVRIITSVNPIPNADNIEVALVDGWKLVVRKGKFKAGDICIYCEIDSFLPVRPEFEFLRGSSYKLLPDGTEGFRLRTVKLRGQISQGLLIEPTDIPELNIDLEVGQDVSEILGITLFEEPIPLELEGKIKGYFPSYFPKTNEERLQNFSRVYEELKQKTFYVAEKLEGQSFSAYIKEAEFGLCTRVLDLLTEEPNTFTLVADKLYLPNKLKSLGKNIALQGELVGPGISRNRYKLEEKTVYFFTGFNIDEYRRLTLSELTEVLKSLELNMVPIVEREFTLPDTLDELLEYADGYSLLNPKAIREGIVIRTEDMNTSFKAISNKFLLKCE